MANQFNYMEAIYLCDKCMLQVAGLYAACNKKTRTFAQLTLRLVCRLHLCFVCASPIRCLCVANWMRTSNYEEKNYRHGKYKVVKRRDQCRIYLSNSRLKIGMWVKHSLLSLCGKKRSVLNWMRRMQTKGGILIAFKNDDVTIGNAWTVVNSMDIEDDDCLLEKEQSEACWLSDLVTVKAGS